MHHAAGPYKSNILWKFSLQAGLVSPLFFFPFLLLCCLSTFISVSGFLFSMCRLVRPTIISACFNPNASTAHFLSCSLLILVIYLSFFSLFVSVLSFHLSLRWVLTASFLFLGRVTSDCKQVCFFTSILFCATVLFYRLIMEAHHLHFTLFEY